VAASLQLARLGRQVANLPGSAGKLQTCRHKATSLEARGQTTIGNPRMGEMAGHIIGSRILGVDPGLQVTGYAVLEVGVRGPLVCEAGVIRSTEGRQPADMANRVKNVYSGIVEVIEQFHPAMAAVEQLYAHYDHPRTAILMAHARGVIFLAAAEHGLPVVSYNATRIKKTITGNGRATKDQVQRTVQRELGLAKLPEPPDVADALAAALCHYYVQKMPV
jgi:crossover junction endodeoxyribonuclease RuvC